MPEISSDAFQTLDWKFILATAAFGLAAGVLAKILMPGKDPGGLISTCLIGLGGSFAGSYGAQHFGFYRDGLVWHFLFAVAGAFAILFLFRLLKVLL